MNGGVKAVKDGVMRCFRQLVNKRKKTKCDVRHRICLAFPNV